MLTPPTNQLFHLTLVAELPWDERQENEEFQISFLKMLMISDNQVHAGFYSCLVIFLTAVII